MTALTLPSGEVVSAAIAASGLTIYDPIDRGSSLFFDIAVLEDHLRVSLKGLNLNYALRTRAKVAKEAVAQAMGYTAPKSFRKTQPRFPGQDLDVSVQQRNNLQIWNQEVAPGRRYAIVIVDACGIVIDVHVLTGEAVAFLDKTGALTGKYQATRKTGNAGSRLVIAEDTSNFREILTPVATLSGATLAAMNPAARPVPGQVLAIQQLYERLLGLIGQLLDDPGITQERNRGGALHRLACEALGMLHVGDAAQFPDILCQAVEVKLQTSPTIDLGLVSPDSIEPADAVGPGLRHCDMRYAVAYGKHVAGNQIEITDIVVSSGESFFSEFQRCGGLVINRKLQIRLPADYFR